MSFCGWTEDSDVYVYNSSAGIVCCECDLPGFTEMPEAIFATPAQMLEHLALHIEAGHKVPQYALDALEVLDGAG